MKKYHQLSLISVFTQQIKLVLFLLLILSIACEGNLDKNIEEANEIIEISEKIANSHNEGLDFIKGKIEDRISTGELSDENKNSELFGLAVKFASTCDNEEFIVNRIKTRTDSQDLEREVSTIINTYGDFLEISALMSNEVKRYADRAVEYIFNRGINLDAIISEVANDKSLGYEERIALCSFIKTVESSTKYWESKNLLTRASGESVVLADCYFLWYGTLSGGPAVGLGAGVLASAVAGLS